MSSVEGAIAELELLAQGEEFSYRKIAAKHRVERTTLARRHKLKTYLARSRTSKCAAVR